MRKYLMVIILLFSVALISHPINDYKNFYQVKTEIKNLSREYPFLTFKEIKGSDLFYVEIGNGVPAVFVGANLSGYNLSSTEASLRLIKHIAEKIKKKETNFLKYKFYVFPIMNPDVYKLVFKRPLYERKTNLTPVDDDGDGLIDEDPPEDLNHDGYITMMRKKSSKGEYIEDKEFPYKLIKASPLENEEGIYEYYIEGIDNDGDGKFNEDPTGGVIINNNFPILFKYYKKTSGIYPTSEKTSRKLALFFTEHKEITLVYMIDKANTFLSLPEVGRTQKLGDIKVKIPERFAKWLGFDPEKQYRISEIAKTLNEGGFGGRSGMKITEEMVASFLGIAPPASFNSEDRKYYEELSKFYKETAKKYKLDRKRKSYNLEDGSFEKWVYFTTGILPFNIDVWSLPEPEEKKGKQEKGLTVDKLKKMSSEEFLKLDEKTLKNFFSQYKIPPNFSIEMLKGMVRAGRLTPEKMAKFLEKMEKKSDKKKSKNIALKNWIEKELSGYGIIKWKKFHHPQLGDVEIGGVLPYVSEIPPLRKIEKNLKLVSTIFDKIISSLPEIEITEPEVKKLSKNVYSVEFYVKNKGYLPFFTKMRGRTKYGLPIIVDIKLPDKAIFIEGKRKIFIKELYGKGDYKRVLFKVYAPKGKRIKISIKNPQIKTIIFSINLGGVK